MVNEEELFGRHVKLLREVRGLTQEVLAEHCGLASDTIRRLEHGDFSPSYRTLRKVAGGFDLSVTQLFQGFDFDTGPDETTDIVALVRGRDARTMAAILAVTRELLRALDQQRRIGGSPGG